MSKTRGKAMKRASNAENPGSSKRNGGPQNVTELMGRDQTQSCSNRGNSRTSPVYKTHYQNVNTLVDTIIQNRNALTIRNVPVDDKRKSGITFSLLECHLCPDNNGNTYKNNRALLDHLTEAHFETDHKSLHRVGLIHPDVQEALDVAADLHKKNSYFVKVFADVDDKVITCPLESPMLKFLFEAPILVHLYDRPKAVASVKFDVMGENEQKSSVLFVFDRVLNAQNTVMKEEFLYRFDEFELMKYPDMENAISNNFSDENIKYFAKALNLKKSETDEKNGYIAQLAEIFCTKGVQYKRDKPHGLIKKAPQ